MIVGGRIDGQILARGAQLGGAFFVEGTGFGDSREALTAIGLRLSGPLILRHARLQGDARVARCQLNAGIYAENMTVDGNSCGFDAESARIDGDFLATGAWISAGLCLAHARLLGRLEATGLSVNAPETLISARSLNVAQGINPVDANIKGTLEVDGAEIGKGYLAEGIEAGGGTTAIAAGGTTVANNWYMARPKLVEAVNLPGADIRGQLRLAEARLFVAESAQDGEEPAPTLKITLGGILYGFVILETVIGIVRTSPLITGFTGLLRSD